MHSSVLWSSDHFLLSQTSSNSAWKLSISKVRALAMLHTQHNFYSPLASVTTLVQLSMCHAVKEASYLLPGGEGRWWIGGIKAITVPLQKTAQGGKGGFLQVHAEWALPGYHMPEQNVIFISKYKSNRKSRHSHTHIHTHVHQQRGAWTHTHLTQAFLSTLTKDYLSAGIQQSTKQRI